MAVPHFQSNEEINARILCECLHTSSMAGYDS